MTRINAFIAPSELTDKHLLAEHREIKRIPNTVKSGKAKIENIPEQFTLGKGHVKFFYNKLAWLYYRYVKIYDECIKRGFNVQFYGEAWDDLPPKLNKDWEPPESEICRIRGIITERIENRLNGVK